MKNKLAKRDDFAQFKTKIFFRTAGMALIAIIAIFALYSFFLQGHFANWVVAVYQRLFRMDYDNALNLYQQTFRNHLGQIFQLAVIAVFLIVFRIYLNWFSAYFKDINRAIDTLLDESSGEVLLPSELYAVENKINTVKHTLVKQKLDMHLAEQRKNDLIVYLAHDLKTPLASVIGYLNLLHDEQQIAPELQEKYLSISLEKAERLEELINEFFEIAKFNLSAITLQYSRISLTRLLEMLLYEFQPMLKEKNLSCRMNTGEDVMLNCDADKIQRVFDNLLRNAVIYSYEDTEITMETERLEDCVRIRFSNYGDTIPQDKLERIFEQFYRLDSARSTKSGGAGLGLAIAKQIVELHHGTITAASKEGQTIFEVSLPIVSKLLES